MSYLNELTEAQKRGFYNPDTDFMLNISSVSWRMVGAIEKLIECKLSCTQVDNVVAIQKEYRDNMFIACCKMQDYIESVGYKLADYSKHNEVQA